MSERITAVIPVRDGARFLAELLDALAREGPDEILVVDSGSTDGSQDVARAAGATLIEIDAREFGHGRTRNLAAERASGDVIAFLTQDATPAPGWLAAIREALALSEHVGAVFGPHLPRPETSPMIARELTAFFATFGDGPRIFGAGDPSFLSNVNAAYRRACWAEIRFDDVRYSEDQAFGRALAAHPAWRKAYHPGAAVLHAHDYSPVAFMRRYFDEYRGLRATIDHVEPLAPRSSLRGIRDQVLADREYMRERGVDGRALWTARSALHHSSRKAFAVLGSRAERAAGAGAARPLARGRAGAPARARSSSATPAAAAAQPLRRRRPRAPQRPGPAAGRVRGDGRPRAPAPRVRHPDLRRRVRRPLHHLPAHPAPRADGPHLLDLGARPVRHRARRRERAPAAQDRGVVRAGQGPGVPRVRASGTAPTWWSPPAGRRSSPRSSSRAAGRAPTWSTTTSPSSSPPPSSASGPSARTSSASTASPAARGCATSTWTATEARPGRSSTAWTRPSTTRGP